MTIFDYMWAFIRARSLKKIRKEVDNHYRAEYGVRKGWVPPDDF
jgi:hypothetical protein